MEDITLFKTTNTYYSKIISSKEQLKEKASCDCYIIDTQGNEKKTRSIIDALKGSHTKIGVIAHNNVYNRRVLETMHINFLIGVEYSGNKDTLKQQDSGLSDTLTKIAKKKKISFIIPFQPYKHLAFEKKVTITSKIMQNIKLCRKVRCPILLVSFAKKDAELLTKQKKESLLYSFGASSEQVKDSFNL